LDREGRVLDCNTRYAARFDKKSDEIIGKTPWKLHPDVSAKRKEALESVFETGKPSHGEDVREGKNGTPIWNEYIISPILDESGEVLRVCLYARDITKRKNTELRLAESEKEKAAILDNSPFHILLQDMDHRVIWANRASAESVGMTAEELKGKKCHMVWANRKTPCKDCPIEESWKTGEPETSEMKTPDDRWWLVTGSAVENGEGETIGGVEITLDITKRKMAERRTDFLISLLRHDVLNRIQAVQGFLELLKHTNLTDNQANIVGKALAGTKEQQDIIERVRLLRKVEEQEETTSVDIRPIIETITEQKKLQPFGKEFTIEREMPEQRISVQGGKLLKPLFSNLIENALEHSEGSKIRLSVAEDDEFITVSIEDDGKGIPAKVQREIMEARFDDEESKSSGLGLYLVKEIAEAYGGRIEIGDSELGGARVDVHLKRSK
ncbi:MAG: PAS domain-containing protein, partial [Candidatus Lokiarchaeota archaeon]|nr:PAS domain-containing protein [Candidatus Lokiarchaeota archaeon]